MPSLPVPRRYALLAAAALLGLLAVAGHTLAGAGASSTSPQPVAALAPASPGVGTAAGPALTVHVVGAVRRAGLYRLRVGSRVADAVLRAGGATGKADLAGLNLAAPLADGVQVVVPRRDAAGAAARGAGTGAPGGAKVSLGSATLADLDALPGVGPVTAQKILAYRAAHGGFSSVDDLDAIPGIGPARVEQLRELVTP
jgi:competence protein ComEA